MEVDELPDPSESWGQWFMSWIAYPSPKLRLKTMKREMNRRITILEFQIKRYEQDRKKAERQLNNIIKRGDASERRLALCGKKVAKYDALQDQCAYSIIKYQEAMLTLEKLDQMRATTTDFHHITRELNRMNTKLNMKRTVRMSRHYDRQMDQMEYKEELMSDLLVERDDMDAETSQKAKIYVNRAREAAGLSVEDKMPRAKTSQGHHTLSKEDAALIARVENL